MNPEPKNTPDPSVKIQELDQLLTLLLRSEGFQAFGYQSGTILVGIPYYPGMFEVSIKYIEER